MEVDDAERRGFEAWYREQHPRLVASLMLICGDVTRASEAVDEAFVRALVRWPRVREMERPGGWITIVARNALRELQRSERRRTRRETLTAAPVAGGVESHEHAVAVRDAVNRLPRRQREVVALHYLTGLTEREVALVLGVAPGTVARTLHDARIALRSALAEPETNEDHR